MSEELDVLNAVVTRLDRLGLDSMVSGSIAMNDTSPEMARRYRQMLMSRSGPDRLAMGASMFDFARRLMRAAMGDPTGTDSSTELRIRLLQRTYGDAIDERTVERIRARLLSRERT